MYNTLLYCTNVGIIRRRVNTYRSSLPRHRLLFVEGKDGGGEQRDREGKPQPVDFARETTRRIFFFFARALGLSLLYLHTRATACSKAITSSSLYLTPDKIYRHKTYTHTHIKYIHSLWLLGVYYNIMRGNMRTYDKTAFQNFS